jgi:hypothetical protein
VGSRSRVPVRVLGEILAEYTRTCTALPMLEDCYILKRLEQGWAMDVPLLLVAMGTLARRAGLGRFCRPWLPIMRSALEGALAQRAAGSRSSAGWGDGRAMTGSFQGTEPPPEPERFGWAVWATVLHDRVHGDSPLSGIHSDRGCPVCHWLFPVCRRSGVVGCVIVPGGRAFVAGRSSKVPGVSSCFSWTVRR